MSIRNTVRTARESGSIWLAIVRLIIPSIIRALAAVAAVYTLEVLLLPRLFPTVWPLSPTGSMSPFGPIMSAVRINSPAYVAILSTLAQIAGISLALYFTAVSVVASTAYAQVPGDVRQLLLRERVGNTYVRNIAFLAAVSVTLLAANAYGFAPTALGLLLASILGIIAVYSMARLAGRIFHFLDPTLLSNVMARDIAVCIGDVCSRRFRWLDPSYQNFCDFCRRRAQGALHTYFNLAQLAQKHEAYAGGLSDMARRALHLLALYAREKPHIPSDSYWFARVPRHQQWFTSDYTKLDVALQTRTMPIPQSVPDLNWFEERVGQILREVTGKLIQRGDITRANDICLELHGDLRGMAENSAIYEALAIHHNIESEIKKHARAAQLDPASPEERARNQALTIYLVQTYWMGLINILLGFSDAVKRTTAESLRKTVSRIRWNKPRTIYRTPFPRPVLERLEFLQRRIAFERSVEGRIISPLWYIEEAVAESYASFICKAAEGVISDIERRLPTEAESLLSGKDPILGAQITQVGLEACNKLEYHLHAMKTASEEMESFRRRAFRQWPQADWNQINSRLKALRQRLVVNLAAGFPIIALLPQQETRPDFFGQAYAVLADECYQSTADGDERQFEQIFPLFFAGALQAFSRLRDELSAYQQRALITVSTDPIVDLLELSGHALIASELDTQKPKLWSTARSCWDKFFEKHPDPQAAVKLMLATIEYREPAILLPWTARFIERTKWQQDLSRRLRERGLIEDHAGFRTETCVLKHPSPVIRVVAQGGDLLSYDPKDIFLAQYLMNRPEASGMQAPRKAKDFAHFVSRQQLRKSQEDEQSK